MDTVVRYTAAFERCGRGSGPFSHDVEVPDGEAGRVADDLATVIYRIAKPKLATRFFDVDVVLDEDKSKGVFSIGVGRFGRGTLTRVEVSDAAAQ